MKSTDALVLLRDEHANILNLLELLKKTATQVDSPRLALLGEIRAELEAHIRIEEEIFYPVYREASATEADLDLLFEAHDAHGLIKRILPELVALDPASDAFGAKLQVLADLVDHYAGEEEKEMFPRARQMLPKEELRRLSSALAARRSQLLEPDPPATSMASRYVAPRPPVKPDTGDPRRPSADRGFLGSGR